MPIDYQIIEMNKAYESMIGIQAKDWIGKRTSNLYKSINQESRTWKDFNLYEIAQQMEKDSGLTFKHLGKYYRIKINSLEKGHAIISLTDVSIEVEKTQKIQTLFHSVPIQVWYLKDTETYLSANKIHADFVGFESDELINRNLKDIFKHPTADICIQNNEIVFREKQQTVSLEWTNNTQGEKKLLKITRNPKLNQEGKIDFVVCSAEDITRDYINKQQKKTQERILYSTMDFTQELLTNKNLEEALANGIKMLGNATKVDRIYYWENNYDKELKQWFTSSKMDWYLDEIEQKVPKSKPQNVAFEKISDFIRPLSQNQSFSGCTKELEDGSSTKTFLESRGILSVLTLPVFSNNKFIGFIGFDSYNIEKKWTDVEISLLSSFVLLYEKALERTLLEQEIKQKNDNFLNFFNMTKDFFIVLDPKGTIIEVNNNVVDRLNYKSEELLGQSYLKLLPITEVNQKKNNFAKIITKGKSYFNLNITTKDNVIYPMEIRNSQGIWNGEPVIFVVGKDVSELALSEDKFSKAFNNSGISMFISRFDDGTLLEVNDKFTEFFGYAKDEIIGRTTLDVQMTRDYDKRDVFKEMIRIDQKIVDLEIKFLDKNDDIRTGLTNIVPVTINNEKCLLTSIIDISDRVKNEKEIIELSTRDYLTNIYNRRFIYEVLEEIIKDSNKEKEVFSVGIIDIDNFKSINDQYGHQVGDDILVEFAKILKTGIRSHDILGRYGGEEFIVIINHADIEKGNKVLQRVLKSVRSNIFTHEKKPIHLTFSAGITSCTEFTKEELTIDKLVEIADKRMYRAKKEGKNKIIYKE